MTDPFVPVHILAAPAPLATAVTEDSVQAITGPALRMVLQERLRQVERHGYTPRHDREHVDSEIALGALAFLASGLAIDMGGDATRPEHVMLAQSLDTMRDLAWPFERELLPPGDAITCYVKAAAMLLAEVDRMIEADRSHG